nr:hypothetical protein [Tanacetum cinerariifolium]
MQQIINELTDFCTSLQRQHSELLAKFQAQEVKIIRLKERVKVLEDKDGVIGDKFRDDALINGRSNNEGEAPAERISNDSEEIARVLTSMDAATVLAGEADVPTGSGFIPTAGPPATIVSTGSEVGPTASPIVRRRKGKEVIVESDTPKKKKLQEHIDAQVSRELEEQQEKEDMRMNEQIARDAEVARIHAEEEIQGMIDSLDKSNETVAKYLQEYQQFASDLSLEKKIELISDLDRETIAKSSTLPYDSAPWVTSFAAEGSMQQTINELTALCTSLQRQYSEMAIKFEAQGLEITRKGKEVMVESETPKKQKVQEQIDAQVARELEEQLEREDQRMSEQIARDVEVARIHVEEELQSIIDGLDRSNETVAKYLQEYQQ